MTEEALIVDEINELENLQIEGRQLQKRINNLQKLADKINFECISRTENYDVLERDLAFTQLTIMKSYKRLLDMRRALVEGRYDT